mgnify:CR=1 FL=1
MLIVFIAFIIFLIVGMPIAFAVGISGALFFVQHSNLPATIMVQMPLTQAQNFALLAVPLFIFAGNLLNCGGTTDRLAKFAGILTGRMRGGYAQTSVVLSTMMGGVSGSAIADAAMEARLLGGDMKKAGYSKGFIACNIAFTGLITATVPPGNAMIIYGTTGNVSIGKLFTTGLVVGLFMMLVMMFTTWMIAAIRGYKPARTEKAKPREVWEAFKECFWALLFPVILLVGIRTGLFTPSEVGAFACVYAAFVGVFIYKEIKIKDICKIVYGGVKSAAGIMLIVAATQAFGWVITRAGIPQKMAQTFTSSITNPLVFVFAVCVILLVAGCFIDAVPALLIFAPIFCPTADAYGINMIYFGVVMVIVLCIGLATPPVGINLYVASSVGGQPVHKIIPHLPIPLLAIFVGTVIVILVPEIITFLPNVL